MQDSRKLASRSYEHLTHRQVDWKFLTILSSGRNLASASNDTRLAGIQEIANIRIMGGPMWFRHQHTHVPSKSFAACVPEKTFGGVVIFFDAPLIIDNDNAVDRRIQDRTNSGIAIAQALAGTLRGFDRAA